MPATSARIDAAAYRFRAFFEELANTFIEREDVLAQVALALLAREHVLLTGPPGTAKSGLANAIFGRIVCEDSGAPSLYSRQITESTVQTDLIGPIDFKNLMETGRTSHFTDEGMLGAAHAFLDEVFDGRDMLLRSALNVLQERELKEGTKVTRGRIEVALMTTNRYIADVIDHARETLLAFVDRIAFIGFVPRGFAKPGNLDVVLRRHVAQSTRLTLDALLTIQDVDVLQELTEGVVVSEPICGALAQLINDLDEELNAAVRADPAFVPTRYLSTRTAVRAGQLLRAVVVHDIVFNRAERELQVLPDDLASLRLHLLLSGPAPDEVEALLKRETDPDERRQLEIVRTEREIFDRCLRRLPKLKINALPRAAAADTPPASSTSASAPTGAEPPAEPSTPLDPLEPLRRDIRSGDAERIVEAMRRLAERASEIDPPTQRRLMEDGADAVQRVAFRTALDASAADGSLLEGVRSLAALASSVDNHKVSTHAVAKWLRTRARRVINEAVIHGMGVRAEDLSSAISSTTPSDQSIARMRRRLDLLDELDALRKEMAGAETPGEVVDEDWKRALSEAEDDLAGLWDAAFCAKVEHLLGASRSAPLPQVLGALEPELEWLDEIRFDACLPCPPAHLA